MIRGTGSTEEFPAEGCVCCCFTRHPLSLSEFEKTPVQLINRRRWNGCLLRMVFLA
jgi:hypothetical protein